MDVNLFYFRNKITWKVSKKVDSTKGKADIFVWTDDEVQLLQKVTAEYKTNKAMGNVD